jgi:hypothetical protein
VGSRSKIKLAYIAGFLDGDGSLMLQLKKRQDSKIGLRFMVTICFYQDSRHEKPLHWIGRELGIGYVSRRKDGMSELRVNGFRQIKKILNDLLPYLRFKKIQARALLKACDILDKTTFKNLSQRQLKTLVKLILVIQNENYVTKKKKTKEELFKILDLTP